MSKHHILALVILSSTNLYTMEGSSLENSLDLFCSLKSLTAYLPSWSSSNCAAPELQGIQKISADISALENKLKLKATWLVLKSFAEETQIFDLSTNPTPEEFLKYSYYQKFHTTEGMFRIEYLDHDDKLLEYCKGACIDGYSAIGAALIARDLEDENNRFVYVKQLLRRGFKPTQKDEEIALSILYNTLRIQHKYVITLLLSNSSDSTFTVLPHDVRQYIMQYFIHSKKIIY